MTSDNDVHRLWVERDRAAAEANWVKRLSEELLAEVKEVAESMDERIRRALETEEAV